MEVQILALCDAATVHGGKINMLGVFDQIASTSDAPVRVPPCSLVVRMQFQRVEQGHKKLNIVFIDADGKEVLSTPDTQIQVQVPPNVSFSSVQVVVAIPQLILPHFGEYQIDLAIDNRAEKSIPLLALRLPSLPQSQS